MRKRIGISALALIATVGAILIGHICTGAQLVVAGIMQGPETGGAGTGGMEFRGAEITLINRSYRAVYFTGYSEDQPLYTSQVLSDEGWKDQSLGWCGTGAASVRIAPFHRVTFKAPVYDDSASSYRIGLWVNRGEGTSRSVIWSPAISNDSLCTLAKE